MTQKKLYYGLYTVLVSIKWCQAFKTAPIPMGHIDGETWGVTWGFDSSGNDVIYIQFHSCPYQFCTSVCLFTFYAADLVIVND